MMGIRIVESVSMYGTNGIVSIDGELVYSEQAAMGILEGMTAAIEDCPESLPIARAGLVAARLILHSAIQDYQRSIGKQPMANLPAHA